MTATLIPTRDARRWRRANLKHRLRGFIPELVHRLPPVPGVLMATAALSAVVFHGCTYDPFTGKILRYDERVDLGVLGRRVITTVGVNFLTDAFQNLTEAEAINWHDSGTSNTAEAIGDTGVTAVGPARVAGTQSEAAANIYRSVATVNYTGIAAVVEHGIFTASTAGTLFDRTVFAAINVVNGSSIQFTWELTLTAGG